MDQRIFVQKKDRFQVESESLRDELISSLGLQPSFKLQNTTFMTSSTPMKTIFRF